MINHPWPALLVTWFLTSVLGASSSVTFAGLELTDDPQKELTNYTFEGFVVEPDGTSAEGAAVERGGVRFAWFDTSEARPPPVPPRTLPTPARRS